MTNDPRGKRARSAAEWFTVMRGADADTERGAFEEWHALPENAAAYARLEETWNESRFLANSAAGRSRNLAGARRKFPRGALLAAGIGLFTLLSGSLYAERVGWFGPAAVNRSAPAQFVAHDAVRTIRLPDGSRVTLGRGAALRDVSTSDERRFVLLRGRARFEVAHDAARSFLVDAGEGRVVAHGTVFDVGFEQGNVRVILIKGSVEVRGRRAAQSSAGASRLLAPGEQLLVEHGEAGAPSPASARLLSWPDAMISFDEMPLAEAVAAFNRTSGRAIRLEGGDFASRRLSGAFRRDDPQGFADALAVSFGLDVGIAADGSLALRARAASRG
ncbi:FecR family protein [Sphingopyxis sp. GC21]|uniref:FecR family protein n=1 Tax=Sphingopyxis sp. GC21 TaxID=2933562 RepID=UPI00398FBDC2